MANHSVAVFSGRSEFLERLRKACPSVTFDLEAHSALVAIIDGHTAVPEDSFVSRIRVEAPASAGEDRKAGDFVLSEPTFFSAPCHFIELAFDLVARDHECAAALRELKLLREVQHLSTLSSSELVSERIVRKVLDLLSLERATLLLHDPRVERYVTSFSSDPDHADSNESLAGISPGVLQQALTSPDSFWISEKESQLVIPIQIEEDMIGVLTADLGDGPRPSLASIQVAAHYMKAVSVALGNMYQLTRSKELAMRDDLTKAYNRRFFEAYLDEEIERSRRYGTVFSVIFLDLDDLKLVNNKHGHLTGSRMLQEVARRILSAVRGIDKVVRFGGDEFCIILPQTEQDQAHLVAERVRKSMTGSPFRLDPDVMSSITASFGIASYPTHAVTKENLIREADAAMYRVKSTTKNAIAIATTPSPALTGKSQSQ